jgi:hypothetical protein
LYLAIGLPSRQKLLLPNKNHGGKYGVESALDDPDESAPDVLAKIKYIKTT